MEYLRYRLIKETVKFLEICQRYLLNGEISLEAYHTLTDSKLRFISSFLNTEKQNIYIDEALGTRINNLITGQYKINAMSEDDAGKMIAAD